jgi:hypothetical protein
VFDHHGSPPDVFSPDLVRIGRAFLIANARM